MGAMSAAPALPHDPAPASDILIVGGGHNGLVCAASLAAAGRSVTVLERRHVVGGAAVTEEFHPGFRNSVAAYTVSLLNPDVIAEMELAQAPRETVLVSPPSLRLVHAGATQRLQKLRVVLRTQEGRFLAAQGSSF